MVFASLTFLYLFLPLFFICYFIFSKHIKIQNIIICIFSTIFYACGEPRFVLLLIISIFLNYMIGIAIEDSRYRKFFLFLGIATNLLFIIVFKYTNLFVEVYNMFSQKQVNIYIPLPIGISFYTFQAISYLVDVYRKNAKAQRKFLGLYLYISMFPQLIAGPIVRYKTIEENIYNRRFNIDDCLKGIERIVIGLAKKVLLANQLSIIISAFLGNNLLMTPILNKIMAMFLYMLQIYFDFSGYSDMAIGMGRIIGFKFEENFNYPLLATSMTDFWRRWHISLGTFFRDYVYIPLGGNRHHQFINIIIVWLLTGIWHGAKLNYVLWGVYLSIMMLIEKYVLKIDKRKNFLPIKYLYSLIIILISFTIFYFEDVSKIKEFFNVGSMIFYDYETTMIIANNLYIIVAAIIVATPIFNVVFTSIEKALKKVTFIEFLYDICKIAFLIIVLIVCTIILVGETNNPFLYMRF